MDNEIPSLSAEIELRDSPEMFLKRDADSSSAVIAAVVVTDRRCGDAGDELPRRRASVEVDANGVSTRRSPFGALPTKKFGRTRVSFGGIQVSESGKTKSL